LDGWGESAKLILFYCLRNEPLQEASTLVKVELRPNESQQQLLRRFRKKVAKSGVLNAVYRKRWFVSKSEIRRIQRKKAIRRQRRRVRNKRSR
jgi:small subunit ribosomal protein S21